MKNTCVVINLYAEPRWMQRLTDNLTGFKGERKLSYIRWLDSIGIKVEYPK